MTTTTPAMRLMLAIASTAAVALAFAPVANAKPKGAGSGVCSCLCDGGANGSHEATYNAVASCDAFNGETCSFQTKDGLIRQGTLSICQAGNGPVTGLTSHPGMTMAPPKSNGPPPKNSGSPDHPDATTGSPAKSAP
jgi:hypothetical protein